MTTHPAKVGDDDWVTDCRPSERHELRCSPPPPPPGIAPEHLVAWYNEMIKFTALIGDGNRAAWVAIEQLRRLRDAAAIAEREARKSRRQALQHDSTYGQ